MVGGLRKLARLIGRSTTAITYWRSKGRLTRGEDALAIHRAVRGRISRARLAPHIYGTIDATSDGSAA